MKMDDHIEIGYREMQVMTIPYQVVVFGTCVAFVLFSAFAGVNRLDSIVNKKRKRNLLEQINRLNSEYDKPLLIIEGESLYGHRNVHPNVVRAVITTRNLLKRFKTIERIVTATKEELMEVEHVGAKTAEHIREVLSNGIHGVGSGDA